MALGSFAPMVMAVVVAFVILTVGIFVFSTTLSEIENIETDPETQKSLDDLGDGTIAIFEIIPLVIVITIIVSVLGMVYNFVRPSSYSPPPKPQAVKEVTATKKKPTPTYPGIPKTIGDYKLHKITNEDDALETAKVLRDYNYWTKLTRYVNKKYKLPATKNCAVYVSKWTKDESADYGRPKWRRI